ncbi:MAG: exo-alpha-sialidase [Clostridia bacterium]|nr:exo-alpha-sialidase [Clostridia bacterium]
MKFGIIYQGKGERAYSGWPTITKLDNGDILCGFSGNRYEHICPFGQTLLTVSHDDGLTFSDPVAVVNTPFDDRDGGVTGKGKQVLVTSFNNTFEFQKRMVEERKPKNADIYLDYINKNANADVNEVCSSITVSEDYGKTFNVKYKIPISSPHGPIVLKDGRYFHVGRAFSIERTDIPREKETDELPEGIYYQFSDDGYNWTEPQLIPIDYADDLYCEPHAIELNNGEVLVGIRYHKNFDHSVMRIVGIVSKNNISDWEKPFMFDVDGSPPHFFRHSSGAIIMTYGKRSEPRSEMATVSFDDGKTWSEPKVISKISESGDLGYPSSVELNDGSIFTAYYQREVGEVSTIKYTIFDIKELL